MGKHTSEEREDDAALPNQWRGRRQPSNEPCQMSNEGGDHPRDGSKHRNNARNARFRMVNLGTRRRTTRPRAVLTIPRQPLVENTRLGVPKTRSQPTMGRVIRLFCSQSQGVQDPARGGVLLAVRFRAGAAAAVAAALSRPVGPEHPQFSGGEGVTTCAGAGKCGQDMER